MSKNIVVIPGSGAQGRATCSVLTKHGFNVHALVKDPSPAKSQQVQTLSLHNGDLNDVASVKAALENAHGLFFSLPPHIDDEPRQASRLIRAAAEASVEHIIYSSVAQTGEHEKFPGSGEKYGAIIANSHLDHLAAVLLYAKLLSPRVRTIIPGLVDHHELRAAYNPDTRLDLVDTEDIGAFASEAFQKPGGFHGKASSLAGESLTLAGIAARLSSNSGKQIKPKYLNEAEVEELKRQQWNPLASFEWQREYGYQVDIERLRKFRDPLGTIDKALKKESLDW